LRQRTHDGLDALAQAVRADRLVGGVAREIDPGGAGQLHQGRLRAGMAGVVGVFVAGLVGVAPHHHLQRGEQAVAVARPALRLQRPVQLLHQLGRALQPLVGQEQRLGMAGGKAQAACRRPGLEQQGRALG